MKLSNEIYQGSQDRLSLIDLEVPENCLGECVVFVHGFMGFKDWGAWQLVQDFFVQHQFGFCKFNLSHNGGTHLNGIDFPDEEAFGDNCYSFEVFDIQCVLEWIHSKTRFSKYHLIGHSRGGGDVIIATRNLQHLFPIESVHTWASISDIGMRFPKGKDLESWRMNGVRKIENSRTKQELPQRYSLYEDFILNERSLSIQNALSEINIPIHFYHGDQDQSVLIQEGFQLAKWRNQELTIIQSADHVFGASHPWNSEQMPEKLHELCELTLKNLKQKRL